MVEDGVVRVLNIEDAPSKADISGVDNLLRTMGAVLP
jgi:glutaredoxin/glutathione-dependent peroxiredoxin